MDSKFPISNHTALKVSKYVLSIIAGLIVGVGVYVLSSPLTLPVAISLAGIAGNATDIAVSLFFQSLIEDKQSKEYMVGFQRTSLKDIITDWFKREETLLTDIAALETRIKGSKDVIDQFKKISNGLKNEESIIRHHAKSYT